MEIDVKKKKYVLELIPIKNAKRGESRWSIVLRGHAEWSKALTLKDAYKAARSIALLLIAQGAYMVQVMKRDKTGKWREERTYPRSADPKKSKG